MPSPHPAALPRRIATITLAWVAFAVVLLLTPLLIVVCGATDLVLRRKGWPTSRMVAFVFVALWIEVTSHLRLVWAQLTRPFRSEDWTHHNHHLMHWWIAR